VAAGLRERKKEKTREALIAAALALFNERGFDHVTVEEIADACDVSPRTFFRYFGSKEDVLFADGDRRKGLLMEAVVAQPDGLSPFAALENAIREFAGDYTNQRDVLRARHQIVNTTPSLRSGTAERQQRWEADVVDLLKSSGRAKKASDLELRMVVATTMTALRVAMETWLAADASANLNDYLDPAFSRLRLGLES
jgi:AcrR family transcriptional regulator